MHGYCHCPSCKEEWYSRNAYRPEDDDLAPYKSKKPYKAKPRGKGCPARKSENRKAHLYVWIEYRGKRWRWYGDSNKMVDSVWWERICIGCGHRNTRKFPWFDWDKEAPEAVYEVRKVDYDWM